MTRNSDEDEQLLERARRGDDAAIAELFRQHEPRLRAMARARLNPRLRPRLDEQDVLQDAYLEATRRLSDYLQGPRSPFFLWLRQMVKLSLQKCHRQHLTLQLRDARREVPGDQLASPAASSACLAWQLAGHLTTPSRAAIRQEETARLETALECLSELDREILSLRHFEQLTNREAALELGVDASTASKRYVRALLRLQTVLEEWGIEANPFESARF